MTAGNNFVFNTSQEQMQLAYSERANSIAMSSRRVRDWAER